MEWIANAPAQAHSAAGPLETEPVVPYVLARPAMRTPLHLSKQGIPCYRLVETVVGVAKATLQKLST